MKKHEELRKKLEELGQGDLEAIVEEFHKTFWQYVEACDADDTVERYDFSGLIFPAFDIKGMRLCKLADFSKAKFSSYAYFIDVQFINPTVYFNEARFSGRADFTGAQFTGSATFNKAEFGGAVYFNEAQFSKHLYFFTYFIEVQFKSHAYFSKACFGGSAYFSLARFSGPAKFNRVLFHGRMELAAAKFHDEVDFKNATSAFLKHSPGATEDYKPISMEGAILRAAHLWGIDELRNYSFKDAVLLGISLADKKLKGCDFTGAVMKSIHTDGWELDDATIANTRYIYTDYEEGEKEVEGEMVTTLIPIEGSRVPADGFFGEDSNAGFTIEDYFFRPHEWNYALDLPPGMRETLLYAVQFFRRYSREAKATNVGVESREEGKRIRVVFSVDREEDRGHVEALFQEFVVKLFNPFEDFVVEFENPELTEEQKFEIQSGITNLQTQSVAEYARRMMLGPSDAKAAN